MAVLCFVTRSGSAQPEALPAPAGDGPVTTEQQRAATDQLASPLPAAGGPAQSADAPDVASADVPAVEQPSAPGVGDSNGPSPSLLAGLNILDKVQIHGFVSEGGFISTANDYIGESSRGSLKLFEGALNVSAELADRLRVGLQFISRSVGYLSEEVPRLDWAVLDYQWRAWLGLRAGVIKMPLGLYNEYIGVDAARNAILLPQSLYPIRNRDALLSHIGFTLYGNLSLGGGGALEYQGWLGTLNIPRSALELTNASLEGVDTKYAAGAQLYWRTPLEGLRIGGTFLRMSIDFDVRLDAKSTDQLIMAGVVPMDYRGQVLISQRPTSMWVASAEYIVGDWLFAAEYSRWLKHQETSLPALVPPFDEDAERFYAMASYRFSPLLELGGYYSVTHADSGDRKGRDARFVERFQAFQRDLAATLRLDVNPYWLWKLEGHFIDGTAELQTSRNPDPTRYWGLFLLRTTVTF